MLKLGDSLAISLGNLAGVRHLQGHLKEAGEIYTDLLALHREDGNRHRVAVQLFNSGVLARDCGEYANAIRWLEQAQELFCELGEKSHAAEAEIGLSQIRSMPTVETRESMDATIHLPLADGGNTAVPGLSDDLSK